MRPRSVVVSKTGCQIRLPPEVLSARRSPWQRAYVERVIGSMLSMPDAKPFGRLQPGGRLELQGFTMLFSNAGQNAQPRELVLNVKTTWQITARALAELSLNSDGSPLHLCPGYASGSPTSRRSCCPPTGSGRVVGRARNARRVALQSGSTPSAVVHV
jgi:hypothetical protein